MSVVAIHPDDYTSKYEDASSPLWADALQAAGHTVKWVDVRQDNIIEQLQDCDALMWRWNHSAAMYRIARRLIPAVTYSLGLEVYPDVQTCWHYDDKVAQKYVLESLNIPCPKTWVWFDEQSALAWAATAEYPVVMKLSTGAGSNNVRLITSEADARWWIHQMFRCGRRSLAVRRDWHDLARRIPRYFAAGRLHSLVDLETELQIGYAYFQEFLPDNDFDTRVTVIGNRAFAFRRFNRENDFRASGSGRISFDPSGIPESTVQFAFQAADKLGMQSVALDILYRNQQPQINEVSYTYVTGAVHQCPGHWRRIAAPPTVSLQWFPGAIWPEQAQIEDFLERLNSRQKSSI